MSTDPAHFALDAETLAAMHGHDYQMPQPPVGGWEDDRAGRSPADLVNESFRPPTSGLGETGRPQHVPQDPGQFLHDREPFNPYTDLDGPEPFPA